MAKRSKNCPHCRTLLDKEDIYEYFLEECGDPEKALETARLYGWGKDSPCCFSRTVGVYDYTKDITTHFLCPDCNKIIEGFKR